MADQYLSLTEYSAKYKVSISTLRRRIKANEISHKFLDGKYLILDQNPEEKTGPTRARHRSSPDQHVSPSLAAKTEVKQAQAPKDEPILTAANRLLTELKKAYTQILQEKEQQIVELKAELADLKTLVKVLESENDRHKSRM